MQKQSYINSIMARFEELLYHELSNTCIRKIDLIGIDFLQSQGIEGSTVEEVIENCIHHIKMGSLVKDIEYTIGGLGIYLKMTVKGCIHLQKEIRVKEDGLEPYICPIANMILDRILEVCNYERAITVVGMGSRLEIDEEKEECIVKCAIYENEDKIGQVSDWTRG